MYFCCLSFSSLSNLVSLVGEPLVANMNHKILSTSTLHRSVKKTLYRVSQNRCKSLIWWFILYQVIFHLNLKKQSYHFRKVKPDNKSRKKLIDFIQQCTWKTKFLGTSSEGLFLDSFQQNVLLHPHCQDILQSTSYQIWDFLPSCWGCLLVAWNLYTQW